MKFVVIFGPGAVGKMTVGQELEKLTGLPLFHNHMTIELVAHFFNYGTPQGNRLVSLFRHEIFTEVAKSDLPGMIFTYMWAFDCKEDWEYIASVRKIFEEQGADIYYVELEADYDIRLARNTTPNRLANKPTKRDPASNERFAALEHKYRLNSLPGEITEPNYIRINTAELQPEQAAKLIADRFGLIETVLKT